MMPEQPGRSPSRRAVFLDRDGVINRNRPDYVRTVEQLHFLPNVFEALHRLAASDLAVVVVTNQSGVGRGLMTLRALQDVNAEVVRRVEIAGGRIDAVYACPHRPDEGCSCRKPQPGMLLRAAAELNVDLVESFLIGDSATDVEAALAAGCRPVLVRTGRGATQVSLLRFDHHGNVPVVTDLAEAVLWILENT